LTFASTDRIVQLADTEGRAGLALGELRDDERLLRPAGKLPRFVACHLQPLGEARALPWLHSLTYRGGYDIIRSCEFLQIAIPNQDGSGIPQ